MDQRSCPARTTGPSKSGVRSRFLHFPTMRHLVVSSSFADASSLALMAEKANAHSPDCGITSVGFNNDGTKIVSGSKDKTIKVWGAGVSALTPPPPNDDHHHLPGTQHPHDTSSHSQTTCSSSRSARATAARSMRRDPTRSRSARARRCNSRKAVARSTRRARW